ncbi:MAG TPA: heavy metal-binding domain-containing protein [Polyangia bacterium]|nr:heavy metal-binding domain-containing protein [Polyangia bacterium]
MIVAVRALLLVLAAAALAAALALGVRGAGGAPAGAAVYACPMHPEVRAAAPGECPICRMALERVGRPAAGTWRAAAAEAADFAAVENVRRHNIVGFVRRHALLAPAREMRAPASVDADGTVAALFYDDEIEALDAEEIGTFTPAGAPARGFAVRRLPGAATAWDRSTARVRFAFDAGPRGDAPRAGRAGWVELAPRPRQVLAVPASAVLQSPEGPYVLAWTGRGFTFERRPIEIGETYLKDGFAAVLSGLQVNERVVARATFFLEADRRAGGAVEAGRAL